MFIHCRWADKTMYISTDKKGNATVSCDHAYTDGNYYLILSILYIYKKTVFIIY